MNEDLRDVVRQAVGRLGADPAGLPEAPVAGFSRGPEWKELRELLDLVDRQPEEPGGGRGTRVAVWAAAELARNNVTTPWVESVFVGRWLRGLSDPDQSSSELVVPSCPYAGQADLRRVGDRWFLTGEVVVPWSDFASHVVLALDAPAGLRVPVVELLLAGAVPAQTWTNSAGEPWSRVAFSGAECVDVALLDTTGRDEVRARWALGVTAKMHGALERVQELCVASSSQGVQGRWDQAVGSVPRHPLVDIAGHVALTGASISAAVRSVEQEGWTDASISLVAAAKVKAGVGAQAVTSLAHQLLGAEGVKQGHPLGHSTRRLLAWREEGGDGGSWARWLGSRATQHATPAGVLSTFEPRLPGAGLAGPPG